MPADAPMDIRDFLIDPSSLDWDKLLAYWTPPLSPGAILWFVNRLGEPFVLTPAGTVQWLIVGTGEIREIAHGREAFARLLDVRSNADEWLRISLVRACSGGLQLAKDECLGFRIPPALMGKYEPGNLVPTNIYSHYSWLAHTVKQDEIYWTGD
jgi:hypothetical protein